MGMPWNGKVCSGSLSLPPAVRVFVHVHLEVCFHFGWVSKEIAPSRRINIIGRGWGDCTSHELKVIGKEFHRVSAKCNGRSFFFFFFRKIEKFFWKICFSLDVYLPETCNRRLWKDFLKLRNRASIWFNRGHRSRLKRIEKRKKRRKWTQRISRLLCKIWKKKKRKNSPAVDKVPVHGNEQSSASWATANGNINAIPVPVVNESKPRVRLRSEE